MKFKIKEIAEFNIASLSTKNMPSTIHYLETSNITNGITDEIIILNVGSDKIPSRARRIVETNDIIYSTVRPNQRHFGFITEELRHLTVSTGFTVIKPNIEYVNPYYLYCYLTTDNITDMLQSIAENSTTAYPSIKASDIGNLTIELPSLSEQNYIVDLIMNLNKKLKNNLKIIKNLEQLSQSLFKHWFVDFEFPNEQGRPYKSSGGEMVESELGEIPSSFKAGIIKDFCELKYGKALTKKQRIPGPYPVYGSGGITGTHKEYLIKGPGLIIGRKGSIGTLYLEFNNFYPIDTVFYTESEYFSAKFLYQFFKQYDFTKANNDSAVPGLNRDFVYNNKAVIPDKNVVEKFEEIISPIYEKIKYLIEENNKLEQLRDTLLPKLLSGEIEIPDELEVK
ncbi:restriction endonuclease subunit S [Rummeliibacillus sp. POC4]|uniref:restriction endonuclease subunit S n=1 Tax=Rummeliibacillus sp. POC4 TaxID=2305899 RepID=UPI000E660604|nr:restriction endonuclease subunit S [Rummeliibacillus sp. POC4]RIJ63481.1 restriction endonuclease subunit S [Rummeliibacillus sp. POC4]